MLDLLLFFLTNTVDLFIYDKYISHVSSHRRFKKNTYILIILILVTILTLLNTLYLQNLNILFLILTLYAYASFFHMPISSYIVIPLTYIAIGLLVEPITFIILRLFPLPDDMFYYMGMFLCEILRYFIVLFLCKYWTNIQGIISKKSVIALSSILIIGMFCCCSTVGLILFSSHRSPIFMLTTIILLILSSYFFIIFSFFRYNKTLNEKHKQELLLQEYNNQKIYYKEKEEQLHKFRKFQHDLKNQLLGIQNTITFEDKTAHQTWQNLLGAVSGNQEVTYSSNPVINTILSSKFQIVKNNSTKVIHNVIVPSTGFILDYGEMGIILGNLIDNALEACNKLDESNRWIELTIKAQANNLAIFIKNSTPQVDSHNLKTTKSDSLNHGFGLNSVKNIVKKYNGTIKIDTEKDTFEVSILLCNVIK